MSQITIGDKTLNFKDSVYTGDQWEQVASWVLNGGAEGIAANAQIATEKAAAASASASVASSKSNDAIAAASDAQAAKNKAANSQTAAKQSEDNAAASATSAANSAASASSSATAAANSAASAAESIKRAPRINSNGKWELWDATKNAYVATEYTAIGRDGDPGTDGTTPHIGENGNWYIGDTDTGVSAGGASYIFKVTVVEGTGGPDTLSANKTFAEIKSAYSSGSMVVVQQGSSLYEITYAGNTKVEFTHVNETYCDVLSCTNSGAPQEADVWLLNRTKRINYDTKYGDIGQKTVPVAIKELQDKSAPAVTDADAGKYLHVNASTKKLEWAEVESGGGSELPAVTAADAGKFLRVSSSGSWGAETVANANGGEF